MGHCLHKWSKGMLFRVRSCPVPPQPGPRAAEEVAGWSPRAEWPSKQLKAVGT
jgi:hypothetical protein